LISLTSNQWIEIGLIVVLVIVATMFSTIDAAFQSLTKGRAQKLVEDGVPGGERVLEIAKDSAPTVTTALFLRMVSEVCAILIAADLLYDSFEALPMRLAVVGAGAIVIMFVIVGVGARTVGRQHAVPITLRFAALMNVLTTVLFFIPQVMIVIGNWITPGRGFPDGPFASEGELREYIDMAERSNQIEADERKMIHASLTLGDKLVKEVMVPRTEVVFIEANKTLRQATSLALRSGFSRIPVIGAGGLDDILGILYLKDVMKRVYDNPQAQSSETVEGLARPVTWCPDSKPVDDLLKQMQATHSHLVVVVDEFGGTAGIATIEDILEEIVGEIVDEYDHEPEPVTALGDDHYRVSSRLPLGDLGELYGLELDDEDVDSVGGILQKQLNRVPIPGATVRWEGLELVADRPSGRRHQIGTVLVRRLRDDEDPELTNAAADLVADAHSPATPMEAVS